MDCGLQCLVTPAHNVFTVYILHQRAGVGILGLGVQKELLEGYLV